MADNEIKTRSNLQLKTKLGTSFNAQVGNKILSNKVNSSTNNNVTSNTGSNSTKIKTNPNVQTVSQNQNTNRNEAFKTNSTPATSSKVTSNREVQRTQPLKREGSLSVTNNSIASRNKTSISNRIPNATSTIKTSKSEVNYSQSKEQRQNTNPVNRTYTSQTIRSIQTQETPIKRIERPIAQIRPAIQTSSQTRSAIPVVQNRFSVSSVRAASISGYKVNIGNGLNKIAENVQREANKQNSVSASTVSIGISSSMIAIKGYKTALKTAPIIEKATISIAKKTINTVKGIDTTVGMVKVGHITLNQAGKLAINSIKKDTHTVLKVTYNKLPVPAKIITKGTYTVTKSTMKGVSTVVKTACMVKTGTLSIKQATLLTLKNTPPIKGIIHGVNNTRIYTKKTVSLVKGVANGTIKIRMTKNQIKSLSKVGFKSVKATLGHSVKTGNIVFKGGLKKSLKATTGVAGLGSRMLENVDDTGVQALNLGLKSVNSLKHAPKLAKTGYNGIKTGFKGTYKISKGAFKTGKGAIKTVKTFHKLGGKQAMAFYRRKFSKGAKKATKKIGKSMVDLLIKGIKALKSKLLLPVIIVIVVAIALTNILSTPIQGVSSIFSGFCSDKNTGADIDTHAWLVSKIPSKRSEFIDKIKKMYNDNIKPAGQYDIVRLYSQKTDSGVTSTTKIDLSDTNISGSIWSVDDYVKMIEPIFYSILMSKYDLDVTQDDMNSVFDDIWNSITTVNSAEEPTEYCNNGQREADGNIHANVATCPNHSGIQYHSDNANSQLCSCDYWYYECLGHQGSLKCGKQEHKHNKDCYDSTGKLICTKEEHTHSPWISKDNTGCYNTNFCSTGRMSSPCSNSKKHLGCNGYYVCNGHKILGITISIENYDKLLEKYFLNDIKALSSKNNLTADEKKKLDALKDGYDFCISYQTTIDDNFGSGTAILKYDDCTLDNVTSYATSFIGYPYKWGGNDLTNGIDCSGFVQQVYKNVLGISLPRVASDQSTVGTSVSSIDNAKVGDLIFYRDGSGTVHHVAIYLGKNKIVHASNSKPYPSGGIKVSYVTDCGTDYFIKRLY